MKKYIQSKRGNLTYAIERSEYKTKFRTPEAYFTRAERNVWYSTVGFNQFVQYKGAFYMVDNVEGHGYITTLDFSEISAEQAANAEMERAAQAMSEAQKAEAAAANAAIECDHESAKEHAAAAQLAAEWAKVCVRRATECAEAASTAGAWSAVDAASEYAEFARRYANSATETAEQSAAEFEERAEIIAAIEDPAERDYIQTNADRYQWSPDETRDEIQYRAAIRTADAAAVRFCAAYEDATGTIPYVEEAASVCCVARDELTGTPCRATAANRALVADMVETIAEFHRRQCAYIHDHQLEKFASPYAIFEATEPEPGDIREWHMTIDIDETAQDFTDISADGAEDEDEARELLRQAWNRRKPRRLHLAADTARIIDVYSI